MNSQGYPDIWSKPQTWKIEIKNKDTKLIWRKQKLSNKMKPIRELKGYIKNMKQQNDVLKGAFIKQKKS